MNNKITFGVGGVIIGVLLASFFAPTTFLRSRNSDIAMMGPRNNSVLNKDLNSNNQIVSSIEQHFIEQMIPHHNDAIVMANIALSEAEHQEIKTLSKNIIATQSLEISQMNEWYKSWFGKDVPDVGGVSMGHNMMGGNNVVGMGMMGNEIDTENLKNTKPFDKEFIREMIPHHQMAVMMAQMLLRTTTKPEMKKLAEDIITAQTQEINQMRAWYKSWYGQN